MDFNAKFEILKLLEENKTMRKDIKTGINKNFLKMNSITMKIIARIYRYKIKTPCTSNKIIDRVKRQFTK